MFNNILPETDGERAVSPVIGVILMVAITVILAAVIGTFVLGLGDQVSQTAPQASFSVEDVDDGKSTINISHGGGDSVVAEETTIKVSGGSLSFSAPASAGNGTELSTAGTLVIDTDAPAVDFDSSQPVTGSGVTTANSDYTSSSITGSGALSAGTTYTVTLVDEGSGQIITEKEAEA